MVNDVLKPKSKEEIKKISENFTDYRIKTIHNIQYLQYKKRSINLYFFTWHIWKYAKVYYINRYGEIHQKQIINSDYLLNSFVKTYPIYKVFNDGNKYEVKEQISKRKQKEKLEKQKIKEENTAKYTYLEKPHIK